MEKKFERFKPDLKVLADNGIHLWNAIRNEQIPDVIEEHFRVVLKMDYAKFLRLCLILRVLTSPGNDAQN